MDKGYICGQGELWGQSDVIGFGSSSFNVTEMSRNKANRIIKDNHYSHKFYNASYIHLGVELDGKLVGVLQYGYAMNPASMDGVVAGTKIDEYLELNRMWFCDDSPPNAKTMAISYSIKYIKRKYPKIAWVQSFADERCGKLGIVYQAANFIYCGEHTSVFWELNGVVYHNSLMTRNPDLSKSAAYIQKNKDSATPSQYRQFRYLYFIKRGVKKNLRLGILPYPKHYTDE